MFAKIRRNPVKSTTLLLGVVAAAGAVCRAASAYLLPIDGDEGQLIYMGHLAFQGAIPLRDLVPPPDPLYVWMLALVELLLGPTLLAIRTLSILFGILGTVGIYILTKEIARRKIAFLATSIYSLSPTIVLYNSIGSYREVAFPMVIVAFYVLATGIKRDSLRRLLVSGVIFGICVLTYRFTAVFLLTIPILFLMTKKNLKAILKPVLTILLGALVSLVPVVALLVSWSNLTWVNMVWGLGGGAGSVSDFAVSGRSSLSFGQSLSNYLEFRNRAAFVADREWFYLALPSVLGLTYLLRRNDRKWPILARGLWFSTLLILTLMVVLGQSQRPRSSYGTYDVWPGFDLVTLFSAIIGIPLAMTYPRTFNVQPDSLLRNVTVYWSTSLLVAFAILRMIHVHYFVAFAGVLSILGGVGIFNLEKGMKHPERIRKSQMFAFAILSIMVTSAIVSGVSMYSTPVLERDVSQTQAMHVGNYIRDHTLPMDQILTGNLIYTVMSGRDNAMKISNPWIYLQGSDNPFGSNPYGTTPSIPELSTYVSSGAVKYVVMDHQLIATRNQQLQLDQALSSHFVLETTIDGVPIYRFWR
jgi:4-amino-4-deoxy-L-arabinose transferase-like glycosyltransferase